MEASRYLVKLSVAFVVGVIGAVILVLVKSIIFGMPSDYLMFKQTGYRLLIWCGI